jgi:hypothetical protein
MNSELKRIQKEDVMYYPSICLDVTEEDDENPQSE